MWGIQPWDNDRAADWFANLLDKSALPDRVRATLEVAETAEPDEENAPLLRAAAYCLVQFGHVYVWPVKHLTADLARAIKALQIVEEDDEYCYSEEIRAAVANERQTLQLRLDSLPC
ncbi:DUF4259 domain-containing protein [Hymenobacter sp. BT635]|uniref:DUF4259 domain-containing protein n=1 Tax=Hymenobacter nitidus TaxID=2880929 RepID=A0ABS8AB45_9BACT|nr:DUF4259 domain-containing protein [Hymenobacter nitidus]